MAEFAWQCWQILLQLAPWLLLGSFVAGLMHVLLPRDFLSRQLSGSFGLLKAVAVGVPLPLCSCAVIPVALGLKQGGASKGATTAFLISTPQTGVDSVLVSASFLGWPFALFKVLSAALTGLVGGWWTDREVEAVGLPVISNSQDSAMASSSRWSGLLPHSVELIRSVWHWLVFGVLASAAITTWAPTDVVATFTAGNELAAMLAALVIALPMYVCATASVPIAAALVSSGLPAGAALVFLMAGPATNVATVGTVYRALGRRALAIYLTTVTAGSILCGWAFGFLINLSPNTHAHIHESPTWWSTMSAATLLVLLAWFAGEEAIRRVTSRPPRPHSHDAEVS